MKIYKNERVKERERERERTLKLNQNVFFVIKSFNFLCRRNKYFFELRLILFSSICTKSNSPTHPTPSPSHFLRIFIFLLQNTQTHTHTHLIHSHMHPHPHTQFFGEHREGNITLASLYLQTRVVSPQQGISATYEFKQF